MPEIMIVSEAWTEGVNDKPLSSSQNQLMRMMLRDAGINRDDCYLTYVFNRRLPDGGLRSLSCDKTGALKDWPQLDAKLWIAARHQTELDRLAEEIELVNPNIIIAFGTTALWALCKQTSIKKFRGTPTLSVFGDKKVLATYSPGVVFRQWKLRPIVTADLSKAKEEATFPQLRRPQRFIYMEPTLADIEWFYHKYIVPAPRLSADIETKRGTITEIGFAPTWDRALVIPFYSETRRGNYWPTPEQEFEAWRWVERFCSEKPIVGQNISYDLQYLWRCNRILLREISDDTMILHHAMFPEMEKSLGFLGSIYTSEPSWKFMRSDNETLKQED